MKKNFKKFIHKFIVDEKGAVSIFLLMIIILIFFFNAVLIDFARIMIADRQTQEAATVSIRSTMSSYHDQLQNNGLFAFDGEQADAQAIFEEVFEYNVSPAEGANFDLLGLRAESDEISLDLNIERSLANKDILEYQILEEMKYKAPVQVGEAIIQNFLAISDTVEEASNYSKVAKEVNELAEDRMEKIDEAKTLIEEAKELLDGVSSLITNEGPASTYPYISHTYDIVNYHVKYREELDAIDEAADAEDDDEVDEDQIEQYEESTEIFKENAIQILEDILDAANPAYDKVVEAIEKVGEAHGINDDIVETINNSDNSTGDDYDNAKEIGEDGVDGGIDDSTLEDFILEDEFFVELMRLLNEAKDKLKTNTQSTAAVIPKVEDEFLVDVNNDFLPRDTGKMQNNMNHTKQYFDEVLGFLNDALQLIEDTLSDYMSNDGMTDDEMEEAIEEEEDKADEGMEESEDVMDELEEALDAAEGAAADNAKLAELAQKALGYGESSAANNEEFNFEDRDDTTDQAMNFIDIIFRDIGNLLVGARDRIYVNEYILMRFNSHDFKKTGTEKYAYANNQVEYMIYGQQVYGMNHLAAMGEIFAVRFAINLADALIKPTNKVFGPFFWAAALATAFTNTARDMKDINAGRSVELFPGLKIGGKIVRMSYQDHLRLFMFIHPEEGKFHRLMAVLDDGANKDLNETPTYVSASASTSIDLWFLPQIADMLGQTGVIDGRVEDGRYYIEKDVHFSY